MTGEISKHHLGIKRIKLGFSLGLLALLFLACYNPFSPPVLGPSGLKLVAFQNSPDSVLYNFKYAYERRDSVVYENCLDQEFVFVYQDQDMVGNIITVEVPRDGVSGDLYRTKGMFQYFEEIRLDTWEIYFLPDTTNPATGETLKARRVRFNLSVRDTDGNYGYQHLEANGFALFLFRKSQKDNLYRIIRWSDESFTY
jgi:hypothetical protein